MYKPEIKHETLTKAEYDKLKSKPASTLYFCYDTQQLFKGETEFCPPDGTGDKLPAVTPEDDGKILGVVDGAWGKTEAPSGNNDFVVTYRPGSTFSTSTTFAEIREAVLAGKNVRAKDGANYYSLSYSGERIIFYCITTASSNGTVCMITHDSNNTITYTSKTLS